jgi:hypothetical protein
MNVKLFVIGENSFFDESKKQSVIGIFDRVEIQKEPGALAKVSIAGSVTSMKPLKKYSFNVEIHSPSKKVILQKEISQESSKYGSIAFIINVPVLPFPEIGIYQAILKFEDKKIAEFPIVAEKV